MASVSETLKKLKNSEDNKEVLYNYSSILSSCFSLEANRLKTFLYSFCKFPQFGVLVPVDYGGCPELQFKGVVCVEIEDQVRLRRFQHELWSDLLKTAKEPIGRVSEANYFVVPLGNGVIDWKVIGKALGQEPLVRLEEVDKGLRAGLVLRTKFRGQVLWKYLNELEEFTGLSVFFECLFAGDLNKTKENQEKFEGFDPFDVIFDENFSNPATKDLRNLLVSGLISEYNEKKPLVFAKQLKSIRTSISEAVNKNTKGVPILPISLFEVFYLDFCQWEQVKGVFNTLIEIEEFSWVLEFKDKFGLNGNLTTFKAAMNCYSPETRKKFENFQILGGVTCKFLIGLGVYLEEFEKFQGKSVEKVVKDWMLPEKCQKICSKFELFRFLKTSALKASCFRPAFFASKETITECYNLEHKITDTLSAGFIRSLIGGILLSNGLKFCGSFLSTLEILPSTTFNSIQKYLNDDSLSVINLNTLKFHSSIPKFSEIFESIQKDSLETILDYQFEDSTILHKALNLEFFNQRLVRTLGKSIIELILAYNLLTPYELDTSLYLYLLSELQHSYNICRITLASGLFRFFSPTSEKKTQLLQTYQDMKWDDHLLKSEHPNPLPPYLESYFYNLVLSLFHDTQKISDLFSVLGFFFADFIEICLKHKKRGKKILTSKIFEILKKSGVKVDYREVENSNGASVKAFIGKDLIIETNGRNMKLAKVDAGLSVYKFIGLCNLTQYGTPWVLVD